MNKLTVLGFICVCVSKAAQSQARDVTLEDVLERLQQLEERQRQSDIQMAQLTDTIEQQRTLITAHEERIAELEDKLAQERKKNDALEEQVLANKRGLADVHVRFMKAPKTQEVSDTAERENRIEKRQPDRFAFTVYLDHASEYGARETIKFNRVVTNEGNGYNVHTGVFTCPESGLYLFSFAIWERHEGSTWTGAYVNLKVNDQHIVDAVVDSYHNTQDLQGSNTAVVRLNQGDSVWVSPTGANHIHGGTVRATSFTGVYLHN